MKHFTQTILVAAVASLSGCATNLKESAWYEVRNTGTNFEQAIANCEYDLDKMGESNGRAKMAIFGVQHPTFEKCMNRFGFVWRKKDEK
jgi:hypothetical protein